MGTLLRGMVTMFMEITLESETLCKPISFACYPALPILLRMQKVLLSSLLQIRNHHSPEKNTI